MRKRLKLRKNAPGGSYQSDNTLDNQCPGHHIAQFFACVQVLLSAKSFSAQGTVWWVTVVGCKTKCHEGLRNELVL